MTITSNLWFLYIFGGSGLLCAMTPKGWDSYPFAATLSSNMTLLKGPKVKLLLESFCNLVYNDTHLQ